MSLFLDINNFLTFFQAEQLLEKALSYFINRKIRINMFV